MKNGQIEIRPYNPGNYLAFLELLNQYLVNEFSLEISKEQLHKLSLDITESAIKGITCLDLLHVEKKTVGFISYQIDSQESDWCERENWGFIREIYVLKDFRRKGFGKKLINTAESFFYSKGVKQIYLTSEVQAEFWANCGYKHLGEVSKINFDPIYEKPN